MKYVSLFLLLVFVSVLPLYASDLQIDGNSIRSIKRSFSEKNFESFTYSERLATYENLKVPVSGAVFKNLLAGFGSGSELQGHTAGHIYGEISDWATLNVLGAGVGLFLLDQVVVRIFSVEGYTPLLNNPDDPFNQIALYTMGIGGATFLLGRVIQAIIPLGYGLRYNKTLRGGLGLTKDLGDAFAFEIALHPSSCTEVVNGISFGLVANLSH